MSVGKLTQSTKCVKVSLVTDAPPQDSSTGSAVDERRARIHDAAIREFSERGFAGTSMGRIAESAGMSRPALYQYFKNKDDLFASAFVALLQGCADRALTALNGSGTTAQRLDGLLQGFEGDLWERLAASPHSAELISRKSETQLHAAVDEVMLRFFDGVVTGVADLASLPRDDGRVGAWIELLRLSPRGFKTEEPTVEVFRQRLTDLATMLAAAIDAT